MPGAISLSRRNAKELKSSNRIASRSTCMSISSAFPEEIQDPERNPETLGSEAASVKAALERLLMKDITQEGGDGKCQCIWCSGSGQRRCAWCEGQGCRKEMLTTSWESLQKDIENARDGNPVQLPEDIRVSFNGIEQTLNHLPSILRVITNLIFDIGLTTVFVFGFAILQNFWISLIHVPMTKTVCSACKGSKQLRCRYCFGSGVGSYGHAYN